MLLGSRLMLAEKRQVGRNRYGWGRKEEEEEKGGEVDVGIKGDFGVVEVRWRVSIDAILTLMSSGGRATHRSLAFHTDSVITATFTHSQLTR
jgi:hypothetical protein